MEHLTDKARAVLDVFKDAVDGFNPPQDKNKLAGTLDPNVFVYKLKDGTKKHSGKAAVLAYLTTGPIAPVGHLPGIAGSKFTPNKNDQHASDTKVHGTAAWVDIDGNTDHPTLNYDFDFDPNSGLIVKFFAD
jgi:hypothetical protein